MARVQRRVDEGVVENPGEGRVMTGEIVSS